MIWTLNQKKKPTFPNKVTDSCSQPLWPPGTNEMLSVLSFSVGTQYFPVRPNWLCSHPLPAYHLPLTKLHLSFPEHLVLFCPWSQMASPLPVMFLSMCSPYFPPSEEQFKLRWYSKDFPTPSFCFRPFLKGYLKIMISLEVNLLN